MVTSLLIVGVSGVALGGETEGSSTASARTLLAPGAALEGDAATGRTELHRFAAGAGQYVHLIVEPRGVPIVATLLDPSRTAITEARDPEGGDAPVRLSVIVEHSGIHQLRLVVPGKQGRSGRYRLTLDPPHAASEHDRLRVRAAQACADGGRLAAEATTDSSRAAMKRYEEARDISHRIGDADEEAHALTGIAWLQYRQGAALEALAVGDSALSLYRAAGDRRGEADTLNNLGVLAWSLGKTRGALAYYERALPLAHELGLVALEATLLSNIGSAHKNLGDARTALVFFERSLPLRRQAGDAAGESTSLANIGVAYRMLGDRGRALAAYEDALPLARAAHDASAECGVLENLGALWLSIGDVARGEEALGRALELSRRIGDRRDEGFVLGWLSHARHLKGDHAQAIALASQELALRRAIGDRYGEAYSSRYLGRLQRLQRDTVAAQDSLSTALRIHREIGDRAGEMYTLLELASLQQDAGHLAAATGIFAQALDASRSLGDPGAEASALFHTAQLRRLQGNLDDARRTVEAAIALLESQRAHVEGSRGRASFFVSAQDAYELLIDLLMTMDAARPGRGLAQKALEASENKRARSLLDLLTSSGVESAAAPQREPVWTLDAQRVIDERTVVLEFSLGDSASYAWAITGSNVHAVRLRPRAEIAAAARAFHDILAAPPSRNAAEADRRAQLSEAAGAELTRLLLAPLADQLDHERVAIVSDGSLHYVPFAALPEPRPAQGDREAAVALPLVVRHEVVMLPSVTTLQRLRESSRAPRPTPRTVAVLADPVFEADDPRVASRSRSPQPAGAAVQPDADLLRAARGVGLGSTGTAFPRLPYSREEADAILEAAAPGTVLRAMDFDASRSLALSSRLAEYDIVHFATHGFVNDTRPDLSGLVLSLVDRAGQPQDGFLRLRDLYGLRLPAELVVLSGCRTGLGEEFRGEGLLGIVRALMHAGAQRVVASMWDVDDRATAVLMKAFYEAMLTSGRSPAAALRTAQLALRSWERWRDPFYWAAFVVEGEWN